MEAFGQYSRVKSAQNDTLIRSRVEVLLEFQ